MNFVSYSHLILLISGQTFELQLQNAQVELSSSATGATPRRYLSASMHMNLSVLPIQHLNIGEQHIFSFRSIGDVENLLSLGFA